MGLIRLELPTTYTHTPQHTHIHTLIVSFFIFLTDCPSDYKPIAGGDSATEDMAPSRLRMWKGEELWEIDKPKFSTETVSFSSCSSLQGTAEGEAAPGLA